MRPIILAFSFIRVPKLFISLLLWPMVIGIFVSFVQTFLSLGYIGIVKESAPEFAKRINKREAEDIWISQVLFGTDRLGPLNVCRWIMRNGQEEPPSEACRVRRYDVAVQVYSPETYNADDYRKLFDGSTRNLHICRSCSADITISKSEDKIVSQVHGLTPIAVYMLAYSSQELLINSHYVNAKATVDYIKDISGTILMKASGVPTPINFTEASNTMILIINTSAITIVALWLSLKGHRRVLDYFARNSALLPLVAACGTRTFYSSLWIITLIRVTCFLLAVIPTTILVFLDAVPIETRSVFMKSGPQFLLWLVGIVASLSSLAIIASIAELKHRHSWVSFLYRYIPLVLCFIGSSIWFYCVFHEGVVTRGIQHAIACLPVLGISPVLLSPLIELDTSTIALHSLFAAMLVIAVLRLNSRWFAAHLEEI